MRSDGAHARSICREHISRPIEGVRVAPADHQVVAAPRQHSRDDLSQSPARPGDERNPPHSIHGFDLLKTNRLHTASNFKCT